MNRFEIVIKEKTTDAAIYKLYRIIETEDSTPFRSLVCSASKPEDILEKLKKECENE